MAEAIARRLIAERGLHGVHAESAGTAAWEGAAASDGALLVGLERSTDLSAHRARALSRELVAEQDLILAMSPHHLERAEALGGRGKSHLLTDYATRGAHAEPIGDPFGGDLDQYRCTYDELEQEIRRALDRIAAERSPGVS
ncbi:MAG: low molecular weight protein arginine phosphatase [Gemmatimonadota bacterium]|nr:low molecular weight protein arginine phosphatase [Gemmatimonadota bacterium]